jgi:hypothetical protein
MSLPSRPSFLNVAGVAIRPFHKSAIFARALRSAIAQAPAADSELYHTSYRVSFVIVTSRTKHCVSFVDAAPQQAANSPDYQMRRKIMVLWGRNGYIKYAIECRRF